MNTAFYIFSADENFTVADEAVISDENIIAGVRNGKTEVCPVCGGTLETLLDAQCLCLKLFGAPAQTVILEDIENFVPAELRRHGAVYALLKNGGPKWLTGLDNISIFSAGLDKLTGLPTAFLDSLLTEKRVYPHEKLTEPDLKSVAFDGVSLSPDSIILTRAVTLDSSLFLTLTESAGRPVTKASFICRKNDIGFYIDFMKHESVMVKLGEDGASLVPNYFFNEKNVQYEE